jgi:AcrR family transcriptional regulator
MTTPVRRGRRPGSPDTRASILAEATALFASHGYAGTTVRAVAAAAGVDAALVHHYFGSKDDLFLAALQAPLDPREVLRSVAEGGLEGAGERLLRTFLGVWDDEATRLPLLALVRRVFDPEGRQLVRDGFMRMVLAPIGAGLGVDQPELRMSLVASQLMGIVLTRYVVGVEPLASASPDELVAAYAPALQGYLEGPLG